VQIVGSFIRETHIERLSEIDRRGARRFDPDAQVDGGVADLSGGRNRAEPEQIILVIPFSVILNQQSEIAFDGDGSAVVAELERMNFAAENADVLELLRQHDLLRPPAGGRIYRRSPNGLHLPKKINFFQLTFLHGNAKYIEEQHNSQNIFV